MSLAEPETGSAPRLTSLAHGGGCGCKLAPAVLQDILKGMPATAAFADLLVGTDTSDDAAVWRLNDTQALVATTDFFMPVVDDPFDFGRIAATNALSDVYAMGARPILALALVGMPIDKLPPETIRRILEGGAAVCAAAGLPVAGGHSIDSVEPIYGLVALGLVHPAKVLTNRTAQAGDALILTKALGVGVLSAALKQEKLSPQGYAALIASTTQLNAVGAELADLAGVHAMTDVTGFGLLGHALEMARGSRLAAQVTARPPLLEGVEALARAGLRTGASARNWASYGGEVRLPGDLADWRRDLLTDPQTSGGLLIAAAPDAVDAVLGRVRAAGFAQAAMVGTLGRGPPGVDVIGDLQA
jgi:selenide,water dikinase